MPRCKSIAFGSLSSLSQAIFHIGKAAHKRRWLLAAALSLTLVAAAPPAHAQDHYQLKQGQWQKETPLDPATPEGQLQAIRRILADGDSEEAMDQVEDWIDAHPNHPALVDAYMLQGDARVTDGNYYKALYDYEYVIRGYPASEQFNLALEREFEIARLFANGVKRRFLGMNILPAEDEAEEVFIRIQERAPGSEIGEMASLELSNMYFRNADMNNAAEAYDLFLQNYPRSLHREKVMLRIIQANLAKFKGPRFDPTGLIEAQQRIKAYEKEFPASAEKIGTSALLVRINQSLSLKEYETAAWYQRTGEKLSAVYTYRRLLRDYPRSASAERAIDELQSMNASPTPISLRPTNNSASQPQTLPYEQVTTKPAQEAKP